jgi:hypothetical protein
MKVSLTKFDIGVIVAALLLAGGGVGAYFWATDQITETRTQLETDQRKLGDLQGRRYLPVKENLDNLKDSNVASESLVKSLSEEIKSGQNSLSDVREMNPVDFKNKLDASIKKMRLTAQTSHVELMTGFHFSFGRYVQSNPSQASTVMLGKQLLAIEQLMEDLLASGPVKVIALRRSFDEDSGPPPPNGGNEAESLRLKSTVASGGLYRTYPFEVEFEGSPSSLREYLLKIARNPMLFMTRSVQVLNLDPVARRREELKKDDLPSVDGAPAPKQPPRTIQGFEKIRAKVRVDWIEWIGEFSNDTSAPKKPSK